MDESLVSLFNNFDRGKITRRQLLQTLGVAAVSIPVASAFGQGSCGGARAGTPACDTTPWKDPFEPTGWKTIALDHFSVQAVDYKKEAAYYQALMGWKVRSDDGTRAVLDIGDFGNIIIRGGFQPPPPPPPAPAGDSAAGRGRGGRGGARPPRNTVWDGFCWGIDNWNAGKVEAELKKRGLNPVADNADGFESFHVKDPDGFDLQISNGKKTRRQGQAKGDLGVPAPFESPGWKTAWLDHISFGVSNYKESAAFYKALLGWKPTGDEGSQNETEIGDIGNIIIRGGNPNAPAGSGRGGTGGPNAPRRAQMDHVAFGIAPWDTDGVKEALTSRGLTARDDTGGKGDIHSAAALYKSYHTTTPQGFDLQISNANKANRTVR